MSELAIGRHLADAFHRVPAGSDPGFADAMLEVCHAEHVDAILPQSSFDLLGLAEAKDRFEGIAVLVSSPEAIRRSNDKAETYAHARPDRRARARRGGASPARTPSPRPPASSATPAATSA